MTDLLRKVFGDERGTSLTEFIITVPIFITVFVGIVNLGLLSSRSTAVWSQAYFLTFDAQVDAQAGSAHLHPASGAATGLQTTAQTSHLDPAQVAIVTTSNVATYGGLVTSGTLGEGYYRNFPLDPLYEQYSGSTGVDTLEGIQTTDITTLVGDSDYARVLLDDSVNFGGFGGSFPILGAVSGTGALPALVSGIRYGVVKGELTPTVRIMGRDVEMGAHFVVAVGPASMPELLGSNDQSERLITAASRLGLEEIDAYADLLGVNYSPRLSSESIVVPCPNPNFKKCL